MINKKRGKVLFAGLSGLVLIITLMLIIQVKNNEGNKVHHISNVKDCSGLELSGSCYRLELADDNPERIKGLSDRNSLPKDSGMLFIFESLEEQCFWMKDMRISLDIIWTNENREIIKIKENVSPKTYPKTFCAENTKYVLEFNAGFSRQLGLKVGTELKF